MVKTSGDITANGLPYPGEAEIAISLTNGSLEPLGTSDSIISGSPQNIFLGVIAILVVLGLLKYNKLI